MSVDIIETSSEFPTLIAAKEWIQEKSTQADVHVPFLLMAVEQSAPHVAKPWRTYTVVETRTFLDEMQRAEAVLAQARGIPPAFHELVPAGTPCKTYAEFDFKKFDELEKFGATDAAEMVTMLDAMLERFIEFLLVRLNDLLASRDSDVVLTRQDDVIVLTAHKASKWSVHVIVDRPLEYESIVWTSTRDCGNFVLDALADFNEPLATEALDDGVYSDNHTLRIYRAAKLGEPTRILRDGAARDAPYSEELMLRSLVTCIRVHPSVIANLPASRLHNQDDIDDFGVPGDPQRPLPLLTSAFIGVVVVVNLHSSNGETDDADAGVWSPLTYNGVSRAGRLSGIRVSRKNTRAVPTSEFVRQICAAPQFAAYEPRGSFTVINSRFATLPCSIKHCELRGGEHGKHRAAGEPQRPSPVYLSLDFVDQTWRQCCWSTKCDNSLAGWRKMDEALGAACAQYLANESEPCRRARGAGRCLFGKPHELAV